MGRVKVYATWPHVIFTEIIMLAVIVFIGIEYLASGSLETLKALVLVSVIGCLTSFFLILSATGRFPMMVMERE